MAMVVLLVARGETDDQASFATRQTHPKILSSLLHQVHCTGWNHRSKWVDRRTDPLDPAVHIPTNSIVGQIELNNGDQGRANRSELLTWILLVASNRTHLTT